MSGKNGRSVWRNPMSLVAEMHYQLRTEGATPTGNGVAVGLGTFIGCLPLYGLHLLLCVVVARLFRVSRIKAYLAANVSNPVLAPFLLYLELGVGRWLFERHWPALNVDALNLERPWLLGRDVFAGSVVVGVVLGVGLGALAFYVARRWRAASFEEQVCEETSRRYLRCGISHWEFVRGKLRYDPMFRALLRSQALPTAGRLVDVGCGRGIVLALLDTARELGASHPAPPGWRPPSARLELVGIELEAKKAAVAAQALGDAARVVVGDAAEVELPRARAFLLLDVLHYLPAPRQEALLRRVARALEPGGVVVLREADAGLGWRFGLTRAAERLCALARGHWRQRFHYRAAGDWTRLLEGAGLDVGTRPMWAGTPYANRLIEARRALREESPRTEEHPGRSDPRVLTCLR
ncbi:MAG TPA: DUF2062 domain-containing protein [Thermoanaerobaculia bacterium]|jgi:uncharacterized protein (DUF2062 family)